MQVEVRGALRFQHRAGLEKGVLAFDDHAYPEFFKSSMWSLAGAFALCERTFEIEPDCDYKQAFRAMANLAVEGTIELRERKAKEFTRLIRIPKLRQWMATPVDAKYQEFGSEPAKFTTTWAEKLVAAETAEAAKQQKEAKRASSIESSVVELPANASHGVVLADGTLALACADRIVFVKDNEIAGEAVCGDDNWASFGFSELVALDDGRVLAFQELAHGAWVAKPGDTTMTELPLEKLCIKGASATGVVWSYHEVFTPEGGKLVPWPDDYVRGAAAWHDGILVWKSDQLAFCDHDGTKRWERAVDRVWPLPDVVLVFHENTLSLVDRAGAVVTQSVAMGRLGHTAPINGGGDAWDVAGDQVGFATQFPAITGTWNMVTNEVAKVKSHDTQMLAGCVRFGDLTGSWADKPIRGNRDTTVALVRGSEVVARFDAKADVLAGCAVGEALAVRLDGTKASKILVWKAGKVTTLAHKGKVRGLAALRDGRLASWGADKTLRIWTV